VASSTSVSLQQEVDALSRIIETKQENVDDLNMKVESAQAVIDETNSVVAQNSQEVTTFDVTLNARNDESVTLSNLLETLSPQADAAEQTVLDLETSLVTDFVPIDQYREQEARLNDLTQIVTERTTLIRELRADLVAIEAEEQLLVKMCLADAQCKVAMGDRLGEN
jgi:peptidoglycan hydrolase CwlO-like protein